MAAQNISPSIFAITHPLLQKLFPPEVEAPLDNEVAQINKPALAIEALGNPHKKTVALLQSKGYKLGDQIDEGCYGKVYRFVKDSNIYAVKILKPSNKSNNAKFTLHNKIRGESIALMFKEEDVPSSLLKIHALVIYLFDEKKLHIKNDFSENSKGIIVGVITDLFPNARTLYESVRIRAFSNAELQNIARQILVGLVFLHQRNLIHRDIKPENILYNDKTKEVKIIDYGFLRNVNGQERPNTSCGSIPYCAPEITSGESHDLSIDMHSLGITLLVLKIRKLPFSHDKPKFQREMRKWKKTGISISNRIDPQTVKKNRIFFNFINQLANTTPAQRLTASDALKHPFITGIASPKETKLAPLSKLRN